ncbi:MAG: peptidylprolyl isomerase [Nitrososphaerales archaeon]
MVNKPRRRKQGGHGRTYLILGLIVVLIVAGVSYTYTAGLWPFNKASVVYARISTSQGSFEVELFSSSAPKTVANFVSLAKSGFYNNLVWHRIIKGFVIQTGDPNTRGGINSTRSTWGEGTSGTSVPFEYDSNLHNDRGYIAMASTEAGSGGTSQFYINLNDTNAASLDGNYAVFGRVLNDSGMAVVDAIANVPVYTYLQVGCASLQTCTSPLLNQPITPVFLVSVTILSGP